MRSPVQLKHLLVAALATIAASCDSNHDGDKGAVWGTDKQNDHGSEISGVNEAGHTKKKEDDKTANGASGENGYTGYYGGSHDNMDSTGTAEYGLQEAAPGATGSSGAENKKESKHK